MRQVIHIIILGCIVTLFLLPPSSQLVAKVQDPQIAGNDTLDEATQINLVPGGSGMAKGIVNDSLDSFNLIDFYQFFACTGDQVEIKVSTVNVPVSVKMELYGPNENIILVGGVIDDDWTSFTYEGVPETGSYFLAISRVYGFGNYTCEISVKADEIINDDTFASARFFPQFSFPVTEYGGENNYDPEILFIHTLGGHLNASDGGDWYVMSSYETFYLVLDGDAGTDFGLRIYAEDQSEIYLSIPEQYPKRVLIPVISSDDPHSFYILVERLSGSGNYTITVDMLTYNIEYINNIILLTIGCILLFIAIVMTAYFYVRSKSRRKYRTGKRQELASFLSKLERDKKHLVEMIWSEGKLDLTFARKIFNLDEDGVTRLLYNLVGERNIQGEFKGNFFVLTYGTEEFLSAMDASFKEWEGRVQKLEGKKAG